MNPSFRLVDMGWTDVFREASAHGKTELRVISPFIKTGAARRLVESGAPTTLKVITRFHLGEMCDGVNDTQALRLLLEHGAEIRGIRNLHAKMYLFGDQRAVVTSANLTEAALVRNHEFGFVSSEALITARCREYFESLWSKAGPNLTLARLEQWERRIAGVRVVGTRPSTRTRLPDEGTDAHQLPPQIPILPTSADTPDSFVKFFGEGDQRAETTLSVLEEVKSSGCHWACSYPSNKRPRSVNDGDIIFMGRLMESPRDTIIYGRATAIHHVPGRDEATPEEIALRSWKAQWPVYIRVYNAEFVSGTLDNGVRLSELMTQLGAECFSSTQENARRGHGNTAPRKAFQQQASVRLSKEGFAWVNLRLEAAFERHGKLSPAELDPLDWPATPTAVGSRSRNDV